MLKRYLRTLKVEEDEFWKPGIEICLERLWGQLESSAVWIKSVEGRIGILSKEEFNVEMEEEGEDDWAKMESKEK